MSTPSDTVVTIKARSGPLDFDLTQLWQFRDLLWALAWRDIRLRYSQTVLGIAWVILQPVLGALVFTLVFSIIARMPSNGVPYFIISYCGLLSWTLFSSTLTRIGSSMTANADLIRKVFFPRIILPLEVIPCALLDFIIALALLSIMLVTAGVHPPMMGLIVVPLCIGLLLMIAFGVGLAAASLSVQYRDIQHILPLILQLLMYGSPVGYTLAVVPEKFRSLYMLNPLVQPIELMRWAFTGQGKFDLTLLAYPAAAGVACMVVGLWIFRSTERKFADVI